MHTEPESALDALAHAHPLLRPALLGQSQRAGLGQRELLAHWDHERCVAYAQVTDAHRLGPLRTKAEAVAAAVILVQAQSQSRVAEVIALRQPVLVRPFDDTGRTTARARNEEGPRILLHQLWIAERERTMCQSIII